MKMADIELVVKISEEDYERLKVYEKAPFSSLTSRAYEAIANGTTLDDVLKEIQAEIRHFMYDINPHSSESDYACVYILEFSNKYKKESGDKVDCDKTDCYNCKNHNYCDYEPQGDEE